MFAEGTHTHQSEVATKPVEQLGQFVDPEGAQYSAPGGHAEIVFKLSAFLQVVGLKDVFLQIFAVGVHSAEFLYVDDPAVLAQALEADERTISGVGIGSGQLGFFEDEVHVPGDFALVDELEAAEIEASEHLGLREGAVPSFGEGKIPTLQNGKFGHHAAQEEIAEIERSAQHGGEFPVEPFAALGDGLAVANEDPAIQQHFIHLDQIEVDAAKVVDAMEVDEDLA